jgi:ABC-type proline/glycine betaine transport system substrate-binding protein
MITPTKLDPNHHDIYAKAFKKKKMDGGGRGVGGRARA